jgi:hypothetical protein
MSPGLNKIGERRRTVISVEERLIIRNLKRIHPEIGTKKIAQFLGRARGQ